MKSAEPPVGFRRLGQVAACASREGIPEAHVTGVRGIGSLGLLGKSIKCGEQDNDHNGKYGPESHDISSSVSIAETAMVIGEAGASVFIPGFARESPLKNQWARGSIPESPTIWRW